MTQRTALAPFVTLLAALAASLAVAQSDPTKPVATVNGEAIGGMEYFRRMEFLPGVGRLVGQRFVEGWPGYIALQQLINERLMLQIAKERGVEPTPAQVAAALKERTDANPKILETLAGVGITRADLEFQIRVEIAEFNIVTQGVTITDMEIEQHYRSNPTRFTVPRRFVLRLIAVTEAQRAEVDRQLAAGKPFGEVAKALSTDGSSQNDGRIGEVPDTAFAKPVLDALEATKAGSATAWVQGSTGWFKFLVEEVKPRTVIPLDARLRTQLRRTLMVDRGRVRNNIERMMNEARRKARIEITQPGMRDLIKEWQQNPGL